MYNNYNPYYFQPQMQRMQPAEQPTQALATPSYMQPVAVAKPLGLLGKSVDSIEVVKATDIPLDGSISYFPIADGSAIVTKQLRSDGTSKTVIYKPVEDNNAPTPKYITLEEFDKRISEINFDDIDDLREEVNLLRKDIKDLKSRVKNKND